MDIAAWAKQHGIPVIETFSPVLAELQPHIYGDEILEKEFLTNHHELQRPQVLVVIEKAIVRDTLGLVELQDGQICYQNNWYLPYLQQSSTYRRRFPIQWRYLKGNYYSLLSMWGNEYYHWFHDVLPKLEFTLPYLPSDTKFLIDCKPRAYQLDSLGAYGINSNKLELQFSNLDTRVENLWFSSPIGFSGLNSAKAVKTVANRLEKFFNISIEKKIKKLYISRHKAKCRHILNEHLLKPLLHDYGFETLTCEDIPLSEQIHLFSNAKAIIAPHGAGLTNMIYAPSETFVGEISTHPTVPCYLLMARQLKHHFTRLNACSDSSMDELNNMFVNIKTVQSWLDSIN